MGYEISIRTLSAKEKLSAVFQDTYITSLGFSLRLDLGESLDNNYRTERFDFTTIDFIKENFNHEEGWFVDLGANQGFFTCLVLRNYPSARILSIEPDPYSIEKLKHNIQINFGNTNSILLCTNGMSDVSGSAGLMINSAGNRAGSSMILDQRTWTGLNENETIQIETQTLLTTLQELGIEKISTLKADIEGMELKVFEHFLRNAPKTLYPDNLIIEETPLVAHLMKKSVIELLIKSGYTIVDRDGPDFYLKKAEFSD